MIKIKDLRDGYEKIMDQRNEALRYNYANNQVIGRLNEIEKLGKTVSEEEKERMMREAYEPLREWHENHPLYKDGKSVSIEEYTGPFIKHGLRKKKPSKSKSKRKPCSCKKK